jgi:hypothetical protein
MGPANSVNTLGAPLRNLFLYQADLKSAILPLAGARRSYAGHGGTMIAVVLEVYGAFCLLSLIAFLVWAWFAELRPDLDEPEFDLDELEKFKKPASCEHPDFNHEVGDLTHEDRPAPPRPIEQRHRRLLESASLYSRLASIVQHGDSHCRR